MRSSLLRGICGTPTAPPTSVAPAANVPTACTPQQTTAFPARVSASLANQEEVPGLRTRTSRTFTAKPGAPSKGSPHPGGYTAIITAGSLNYQDAKGVWQPIDNTLVPSTATGYAHQNTGNRYTLRLPTDLTTTPVQVTDGSATVAFALHGATGTGTICGATKTYATALPGVSLAYTAHNDAVQETLTLATASAPHTFVYSLTPGSGLTAKANSAGGIDFVDAKGAIPFTFVAPSMDDASHKPAGHSTAVTLTLGHDATGQTVTLTPDAAWLTNPARVYPAVIDPDLSFTAYDCGIVGGSGANTSNCAGTTLNIGYDGTQASRVLMQSNVVGVVPANAQVEYAEIGLDLLSETTSAVTPLSLYPVTRSWSQSAVTWNKYDGTNSWTTAGGDFSSTASDSIADASGAAGFRYFVSLQPLVQSWVNGTATNNGVIIKEPTENVTNVLTFASSRAADNNTQDYLNVTYQPWLGAPRAATLTHQQLSDRMDLGVNVANGNLLLHNHDLQIAGTGLDLSVDRSLNSLSCANSNATDLGPCWNLSTGADVRLYEFGGGSMTLFGPDGSAIPFLAQSDGLHFTSPAGIDATLVENDPAETFTLTFHQSGAVWDFDQNGVLTDQKDKNGNTLSFSYNGSGTTASVTDTQGRSVTFGYNGSNQLTSITDTNGPSTRTYSYGYTSGKLTSATDPVNGSSHQTLYAYTSGNLTQITDPNGNVTKISYDTSTRVHTLIRVTNVGLGTGPTTTFTYNSGNTVVTDANSHTTTYNYDVQGRVTSVQDALSHSQSTTYNPDNNTLTYTDALTKVTTLIYGANGGESLTQAQVPTGATANMAYTDVNHPYLPSSMTDAQGNQFTYAYNTPGNPLSTTNQLPANNVTSATYNTNGTVATTTDALSHQTTYGYTYTSGILSQIVITPPTPQGTTTLHFDGDGRVSSRVDGKSQTTNYTYDKLDRVTRITYNGDTGCASRTTCTDYGFDNDGNQTSLIDNTGTTNLGYDALNRQTSKTLPTGSYLGDGHSVDYGYDSAGNLTSLQDLGGTVAYGYDAANRLTSLAEPGGSCTTPTSKCTTFTYNSANKRLTTSYPNNVVLTQAYDDAQRLTSITGTNGGTTLTSFTYTYSQSGTDRAMRQTMVTGGVTTTYSYDKVNRLTGANASGANYQYTYDGAGNRLTATLNGSSTFATPTYNSDNALTALGTMTLGYDGNGNETGRSTGITAFGYNAKNQTTSMTDGTALAMGYTGDTQIERTSAGSTTFAYTVLGLSSAITGGNSTYYTRDNAGTLIGERIGTNAYYYLFDGLGSVVAVTGSAGTALDTYAYDPYGQVTPGGTNSVVNPWQYTGGYLDSQTGLVKLGQRFYDPTLGRWTQQDPMPQGNLYVYAGDNPINFVDPTGTFPSLNDFRNAANKGALIGGDVGAAVDGIAGGIGGGVAGFAVGGPPGAVVGAAGGFAAGAVEGGAEGAAEGALGGVLGCAVGFGC